MYIYKLYNTYVGIMHMCKGKVKIREYEILLFCFKALLASKS